MLRSLFPEYPTLPENTRELVVLQVEDAVRRHRSLLPRYMLYPLLLLGWVFECLPLLWKGRCFGRLPVQAQERYLGAWQSSPLAAFIELHRSMVVLTYLDHPTVRAHLERHG